MKKLMVLVVLLAVALIAAPAIAQNESTNPGPPPGEVPDDSSGAPFPKEEPPPSADPAPAAPPSADPVPEPSLPEIPTKVEEPAPVIGDNTNNGPSDDAMSTDTGGVANTDTGSDVGDGPGGSTRNDIVEDLDEDADDDAEEEGVNTDDVDADEVDAEDREDRIADRILADLKDGKKDSKKKDKDDDEDADEDGVDQSTDQDADSGDVDQDANVINTGDNVNQCVAILQVANTGNAQNANGIVQSDSEADDIELEDGSTIDITPRLVVECRQVIRQVVRAERLKGPGSKFRTSQIRAGGAPIVRTGANPTLGAGTNDRRPGSGWRRGSRSHQQARRRGRAQGPQRVQGRAAQDLHAQVAAEDRRFLRLRHPPGAGRRYPAGRRRIVGPQARTVDPSNDRG